MSVVMRRRSNKRTTMRRLLMLMMPRTMLMILFVILFFAITRTMIAPTTAFSTRSCTAVASTSALNRRHHHSARRSRLFADTTTTRDTTTADDAPPQQQQQEKFSHMWVPLASVFELNPDRPNAVEFLGKTYIVYCANTVRAEWVVTDSVCPHRRHHCLKVALNAILQILMGKRRFWNAPITDGVSMPQEIACAFHKPMMQQRKPPR